MRLRPYGIAGRFGTRSIWQLLLHLPNFLKLFLFLFQDARVSLLAKLVPMAILAYLILPVDLLPDFLPALGQLDDLVVLLLGFKLFLRLCPPDVVQQHVKAIAGGR
jgi:uncharacterized membrane protein YkvA (DUF1232 family)